MRVVRLAGYGLVSALLLTGCGGSGYGSSPSPSPTPTPTPNPPAAGTVDILGERGNRSFTPNPSSTASDGTVKFQNTDGTTHRIVANDGSFDTGNLTAGAGSAAMPVNASGVNYHCTIHPSMVGAINATNGTTPPCQGQYCAQAGE